MASRRPAELTLWVGNGRSQAVILLGYGHFASRAKPFWRPQGAVDVQRTFDPLCPGRRWQARQYRHIPLACRLSPEQNGLKPRR